MTGKKDKKKVVLAYSGGLDTSVILRWLIETYGFEVICFAADIGQGEELDPVREKAIKTGASKIYIENVQDIFASEFVFPMLRANAFYENSYLLGTSIARPLIARELIKVAKKERAAAVSHGATGKGNDQVRFELAFRALAPDLQIVAPWREWDLNSRESLIKYARKFKIPVPITRAKPYSSDRNLFHISFEGGILEDPWVEPRENMYVLTVSPQKAPAKPVYIEIEYEKGDPVAVEGEKLKPADLVKVLNDIGGKHGVGRIDIVENRFVGMKSRGVYETPGGTILHIAHRAIESITMDREVMHLRDSLIPQYAKMVYNGFWFAPEREMLQAAVDESQKGVSGTVRLKLYKGNCTVVGRKSGKSLYSAAYATFEADDVFDQKDAEGFIRLNSLRLMVNASVR